MGGRKVLHGHGLRDRMQLGPTAPDHRPHVGALEIRRYQCQRCTAVVVSLPRGVLPRLRYRAVAVAMALVLWTVELLPAHVVRQRVSPFAVVGHEACRGWRSLRRWARAGPRLWSQTRSGPGRTPRELAHGVVRQLAALAPLSTGDLLADACAGALRT